MLIKSLVLILVNDSILGHKNERAELAVNAKEESVKKKNRYKENSMWANYLSNSFNELSERTFASFLWLVISPRKKKTTEEKGKHLNGKVEYETHLFCRVLLFSSGLILMAIEMLNFWRRLQVNRASGRVVQFWIMLWVWELQRNTETILGCHKIVQY